MDVQKLVRMANQIADNFDYGQGRDKAVKSAAEHLRKSWTPDMKQQIVEHYRSGQSELNEKAAAAVAQLAEK
ncbi:MAG TPA: formate dehydrogenase subunit delta [Gammaproteobacteria bacterium]|nr:formate dehydrogenase subunit delta [Gammaproteobacteria bacterium]